MTNSDKTAIELHSTCCAICHTFGNATELYPANFGADSFNAGVYSARRLPDRIHYRMVRCNRCGLVRSDPVADGQSLAALYAQSDFTYDDQIADLRYTYGRYLASLEKCGAHKGMLLEIGSGNGFFLEEALAQGYAGVRGVEPGVIPVSKANAQIRPYLVCDVMRPGLFEPGQFDVICMFQVFDHVAEPGTLLAECFRVLNPGGFVLCLNHNVDALSARLLRERSPIIDIEHTYLYTPATLSRLFAEYGFQVRSVGPASNRYALSYLMRLFPLPTGLKSGLLKTIGNSPLGRITVSLRLGNLYLVAQKPIV
jgi:SAM-dependent methyltransferase